MAPASPPTVVNSYMEHYYTVLHKSLHILTVQPQTYQTTSIPARSRKHVNAPVSVTYIRPSQGDTYQWCMTLI